jgi:glycosyltransferase involved in cell wall biosynthesis
LLGISFSFSAHAGLDVTGNTTFQSFKVRRARFVLVCNEANRQFLCLRNPDSAERIRTVHHGVDLSRMPASGSVPKAHPPEIVAVGRLAPEKGFRDLLAASEILHDRGLTFRLRIFGEGPERAALAGEIASRRLGDFTVLEGIAPHGSILDAFARATLVTLASYRSARGFVDGIPNVLVEAMACGTPVVSTDYLGARELLQEGAAGMLVPQRDPGALAGALEALLKDPERRAQFAARGRRRVEEAFDRARNIEPIVELLSNVLVPSSPAP